LSTDITLFIEYGSENKRHSLTRDGFYIARDYDLFKCISKVRGDNPSIAERGFPIDASANACWHYYQLIDDDDIHDGLMQHISRNDAAHQVSIGNSFKRIWNGLPVISDPDARHPNWLTRQEFISAITDYLHKPHHNIELMAVISCLNSFPEEYQPRVIYWFDC
jgi:hypothetical protein